MGKWFSITVLLVAMLLGWQQAKQWEPHKGLASPEPVPVIESAPSLNSMDFVSESRVPMAVVLGDEQDDPVVTLLDDGRIDDALTMVRINQASYISAQQVLRRLAEELINLNRVDEAMDLLYESRLYASPAEEEALLELIYELVEQSEKRLAVKPVRPDVLVAFYQNLVVWQPDYVPYYLKLATWQILAGEFAAVELSLSGAVNDARYAQQVADIRRQLDFAREELQSPSLRVPLTREGKHFVVDAQIDNAVMARLLLDTGASVSVLKDAITAQLLVFDVVDSLSVNTANGVVQGRRLRLPQMSMGELRLDNIEVGTLPLDSLKFDGLLGMDVLGQFDFVIDQEQSELLLRPRG